MLPNSASDQRQQLLRRLAAGDPGVDIMSLDPVFVAEFAQAYGFEMSQTPAALLAAHRSALASGAVIADPKAAPAPLRVPDTSKPENLDVPTAGIDDDLLDNL